MEITKKAEYAMNALVELALSPDQYISSREIAKRQSIPPNFLPQIIATLGTRGWVEGVRGPGGGVRLLGDPEKISVAEVVELIEGPLALSRCLVNDGVCVREGHCPLHSVWAKAQTAMISVLSETTLADVVKTKLDLDKQAMDTEE